MNNDVAQLRQRVAKAGIAALVVCVVLTGLGYGIAKAAGSSGDARDIAMVGGALILAGVPGLGLAVGLTGRLRGGAAMGFVSGALVRMPVGGVLALYGLDWGLASTGRFAQYVAGGYLVFLVVEVLVMSPAVKATATAAPAVSPDAGPTTNDTQTDSITKAKEESF